MADPTLEQIIQRMIDEGAPEEAIAAVVQSYQGEQPQGSAVGGFFDRLIEVGKSIPGALKTAVSDPLGTVQGMHEAQMQQFDKAGAAFAEGRYSEALGHGGAGMLPGIGPAAASIGEDFGSGDSSRIGRGTADALLMAVPGARHLGKPIKGAVNRGASALANNQTVGDLVRAGGVSGTTLAAARGLARGVEKVTRPRTPGLDRYSPNASGRERGHIDADYDPAQDVTPEVRALNEPVVDRYAPNVSTGMNRGGNAAADASGIPGTGVDRYMPNTSTRRVGTGDVAADASDITMTGGPERYTPNVSNPRAGAVNAADDFDPVVRTESGLDPHMPNVSGRREGVPAEFMTPDEEAAYNAVRELSRPEVDRYLPNIGGGTQGVTPRSPGGRVPYRTGDQSGPVGDRFMPNTSGDVRIGATDDLSDLTTGVDRYMPNVSTRERLTRQLNEADAITDAADREFMAARPAMPRAATPDSMRGLELVDEADVPQSMPGMGEVDELIGSMNPNVPHSRRMGRANQIAERTVENHQRRRRHGVAGFRNLPELPAGELDRISKIIAGIEARRGGGEF